MKIDQIEIQNYRGIKNKQVIPIKNFSTIVGKNDSGKSIIIHCIASFLDPKSYKLVESDFNNINKEIIISCCLFKTDMRDLIKNKLESKIKKNDGLEAFLDDIIFENKIFIQKRSKTAKENLATVSYLQREYAIDDFKNLSNNQCLPVQIPDNAQLDYLGHSWECQRGFSQANNQCLPVQVPENAQLDYLGHSWECQRGFSQANNQCLPVQIPENAQLDYLGHSWECQRGFSQANNQCLPVQIPENAQLDYLGHSWKCQRGFNQIDNRCLPIKN